MGENWESFAAKIAPLDFRSLDKVIKAIEKKVVFQKSSKHE